MDQRPDLEILEKAELFRGTPAAVLAEIQTLSFRKRLGEGEVLVRQGDPATTLHIVASGRLRVTQTTSDGQQVIIRYLGPGDVAGYAALSGGETHPGTVTAVDDCLLLAWNPAAMKRIMMAHPIIALS